MLNLFQPNHVQHWAYLYHDQAWWRTQRDRRWDHQEVRTEGIQAGRHEVHAGIGSHFLIIRPLKTVFNSYQGRIQELVQGALNFSYLSLFTVNKFSSGPPFGAYLVLSWEMCPPPLSHFNLCFSRRLWPIWRITTLTSQRSPSSPVWWSTWPPAPS